LRGGVRAEADPLRARKNPYVPRKDQAAALKNCAMDRTELYAP